MPLNKATGNMYDWKKMYTWNPIGGACEHECSYCYVDGMKKKKPIKDKFSGEPRIWKKELSTKLGEGKTIFVQSMGDLFAEDVPGTVINEVLDHILEYPDNKYLFQSKNPHRIKEFLSKINDLPDVIIGTTIETDDDMLRRKLTKAPHLKSRYLSMGAFKEQQRMISIEPIMKFDYNKFIMILRSCNPDFVSIGADSQKCNLPEPTSEEIERLITTLQEFTEVKLKKNLKRIYKGKTGW